MVALAGHADTVAAAAAAQAIDQSGSFAILLVTLAAFALGPVILTFGLWRAGIAPIWPAILWIAGVLVVNGTSNSSRAAATVGMLTVGHRRTRLARHQAHRPAHRRTSHRQADRTALHHQHLNNQHPRKTRPAQSESETGRKAAGRLLSFWTSSWRTAGGVLRLGQLEERTHAHPGTRKAAPQRG